MTASVTGSSLVNSDPLGDLDENIPERIDVRIVVWFDNGRSIELLEDGRPSELALEREAGALVHRRIEPTLVEPGSAARYSRPPNGPCPIAVGKASDRDVVAPADDRRVQVDEDRLDLGQSNAKPLPICLGEGLLQGVEIRRAIADRDIQDVSLTLELHIGRVQNGDVAKGH